MRLSEWFDELLGDIDVNDLPVDYPFALRVGCVKMAAPRHPRFDFVREMGAAHLDAVFHQRPLNQSQLVFVFPERHMGVHEQQAFFSALLGHPEVNKVQSVDILTSSPLILGDFYKESIRILTWSDDEQFNGRQKK